VSNITTIYDGIVTKVTALFTSTHVRIPQPYDLRLNKTHDLRKGFGVKYLGRLPAEIQTSKSFRNSYNFSVVFAEEVVYLPSDSIPLDITAKSLLEAEIKWSLNAYDQGKLDLGNAATIINIAQADGIFVIFEDKNNFLSLETFFTIETKEATLT